jgi:single-stranded-DNA-specific exonuclease
MHRKWFVQRTNAEYVSYLSRTASISPPLAQVLINRGIKTPEDVSVFLTQTAETMSDPFGIEGIETALKTIHAARESRTKVLVHGDYDADGLTATAIMVAALRRFGIETHYFIPNRFEHGYGFNTVAVKKAKDIGAGLIITVDCGISSVEATEYARSEGIDVIITDHHEPVLHPETKHPVLPKAVAVINPKLSGSKGVSALSGAGVALKLAQAMFQNPCHEFFDLATLGTLADAVPLIGENRVIVKEGLNPIEEGIRTGINALRTVSGLNGRPIKAGLLSFTLVPRINAAGRISDASEVVDLLLTTSEDTAVSIASSLDRKNSERQKIEETVYNEALEKLEQKDYEHAIVLAGEGWHEGVIGIVASRIAEKFYRPTFILSIKNDIAKGSARSIPEFDVYAGLVECRDLLISFGGHTQAAGLKLNTSALDAFEKRISSVVAERVKDFTPSLQIDADISLSEINFRLVREIEMLEPFGPGNSEPVFGSKSLEVIDPRIVGNNHLKMKLRSRSQVMNAIGFDMGELYNIIESTSVVDAAYTATVNEWEGGKSLQLNLKALRPANL